MPSGWAATRLEIIAVAAGDEGARQFLAGRSDVVRVEIGDVATGADMDTNPMN